MTQQARRYIDDGVTGVCCDGKPYRMERERVNLDEMAYRLMVKWLDLKPAEQAGRSSWLSKDVPAGAGASEQLEKLALDVLPGLAKTFPESDSAGPPLDKPVGAASVAIADSHEGQLRLIILYDVVSDTNRLRIDVRSGIVP